ncbi:MAG: T9SS type A sorting domain-containing protein, partial [Bacteroidota bacterium]
VGGTTCHSQSYPESHSAWFKWKIKTGGSLAFTLLPLDEKDDIDFVLFRLPNSWDDCASKVEVRCMASGENLGEADATSSIPCTGATGLSALANDVAEKQGCQAGDDNFLVPVQAQAGETYALFVNNYASNKGFLLEFSGDCEFQAIPVFCEATESTNPPGADGISQGGLTFGAAFPNPARTQLIVPFSTDRPYRGDWQLIDLQGSIQRTQPFDAAQGTQQLVVPTSDLLTGVYFLKIKLEDNEHLLRFAKF